MAVAVFDLEADELRAQIGSTKRLVRLLMGQARATVQALAGLAERLDEIDQRLNSTAQEAQDGTENEDRPH